MKEDVRLLWDSACAACILSDTIGWVRGGGGGGVRVQELCETVKVDCGGRLGLSVLMSLTVICGRKSGNIEPCLGIGHSLSLICQPTSGDMKFYIIIIIISHYHGGGGGGVTLNVTL